MRKLLIAVAAVVVLLAIVVGVAVMNLNGLLERNRERIAGMASDAVGREVRFSRAEVAFSQGLAVELSDLEVAEDPRFGEGDFVELDSAFVGVRIWPLLFGELEVSGVLLEAPRIQVIQTAAGFNFSTLGADDAAEPGSQPPPEEEGSPLALAIAAFEIRDGVVTYEDRTTSPPRGLTIEDLEASGTDLALEGPVAITFSGRLRKTDAPAEGRAVSTFSGEVDLEDVATTRGVVRLQSPVVYPSIVDAGFAQDPKADHVDDVAFEAHLPADPASEGYRIGITTGTGDVAGYAFEDADLDVVYRSRASGGAEVTLEKVRLGIADGDVEVGGRVELGAAGQPSPFDLKLGLRDLASGRLASMALGVPAGLLTGRLGGDVSLAGPSLEWDTLKRTLRGSIDARLGEGALENVNLLDRLVGQLVADPGLGRLVAGSLREAAPGALEGNRTEFRALDLDFDIRNGQLSTDGFELAAGDFTLDAKGSVGLDGSVAGGGRIELSESISRALVKKTDALKALEGEGGRLALPISLAGTASSPSLRPDLSALANVAKQELKDRAVSELSDRLFGKKKDAKSGEGEGESGDGQPSDRDAAEGALREGIGRLLGD